MNLPELDLTEQEAFLLSQFARVGMVICCPPEKLLDLTSKEERDRLINSWIVQVTNTAYQAGKVPVGRLRQKMADFCDRMSTIHNQSKEDGS